MKLPITAAMAAIAISLDAFQISTDGTTAISATSGETEQYAADELERLLGRCGVECRRIVLKDGAPRLVVGGECDSDISKVENDGYAKTYGEDGAVIAARTGKGVLNGTYDMARDLGFAFVMPGEKGELVPETLRKVPNGSKVVNPRFKYRGVFSSSACVAYSTAEWYAFLAKLRFNAYCWHASDATPEQPELLRKLGFRYEAGGHVMHGCLPREKFEKQPELFRMFQPEDFNGKRMPDSNFCITHPETRRIVKDVYLSKIAPAVTNGVYAVHAWADDLPAGGWCMCSRCRGLEATDQSALAMNAQAEALREAGIGNMRVPVLAYHDTMFPSSQVEPDPLCFLLFAPRERCYGHAINDPKCARNRIYMKALKEYAERFAKNGDAHTFEYYSDKLLFRGHVPFLPDVIYGDAIAYEENGIDCWMSLQVGGEPDSIDWNMLAHSDMAWDRKLTALDFMKSVTETISPSNSKLWNDYLQSRSMAEPAAWKICDYPFSLYFDYRFLPERGGATGASTVTNLDNAVKHLARSRQFIESAAKKARGAEADLAGAEARRSNFEFIDFMSMVSYAAAMNQIGNSWNPGAPDATDKSIDLLNSSLTGLSDARKSLVDHLSKIYAPEALGKAKHYYLGFSNGFMDKEIQNKINILRLSRELGTDKR